MNQRIPPPAVAGALAVSCALAAIGVCAGADWTWVAAMFGAGYLGVYLFRQAAEKEG